MVIYSNKPVSLVEDSVPAALISMLYVLSLCI